MAEKSVRSGREGEKIANEILKLIGWGSVACNIDIDCAFPSRHKAGKETKNPHHGIDILYSYDNPLYHDRRDIIIGSVKHSINGYTSSIIPNLNKSIIDLIIELDCARESDDLKRLVGNSKLKTQTKGLLFLLSSLDNEKEYDITNDINNDIDFGTNRFEEIFIVDNKRATFLVSSIKTAETYMPSSKVKFLYQNTGKNMDKSQLLISGDSLPVQLINSEIIPIVKEDRGKISCLIFCNNIYSKENVSRLIWFSHKLCGLINEIRIYLPNYDDGNLHEINSIKQLFKDDSFTTKISFHRFSKFDFISLKEEQQQSQYVEIGAEKPIEITHSEKISNDIDKILPYGDFLLPKLSTSLLSEINLRNFLIRKGIITFKKSKNEILPIFSCLLLSPSELDNLKATYKDKEDRTKEIERRAKVDLRGQTLWETINTVAPNLKSISSLRLPKNCAIVGNPSLERVGSNYDSLIIKYTLEKENTNKDFLSGKTYHDAQIEIKYKNSNLDFTDTHTSPETYNLNKIFYDTFQKVLKKNNILLEDFKSIKFLDFNNNQRIQFLLSFLELMDSRLFEIRNMTLDNMKIRPDETISPLPKDLESFKGRVSNLNLYGKELNDTIYLSEEEYRGAILCEKVRFNVVYKYLNRNGICTVEVAFNGALGMKDYHDTELKISISPTNNSYDTNFKNTKSIFVKEINEIKHRNYHKHKQSHI